MLFRNHSRHKNSWLCISFLCLHYKNRLFLSLMIVRHTFPLGVICLTSLHKYFNVFKDRFSRIYYIITIYIDITLCPTYHCKLSWPIVVEEDLKVPFSIATTPRCREGHYSFLWSALLTLNPYLKMLSVKQGGSTIFWVFGMTWPWIEPWSSGEHSNHYTSRLVYLSL